MMSYSTLPSNPFTVPGTEAGFLDIRKKGTTGPVVTVAVPAYTANSGTTTPPAATQLAPPTGLAATATSSSAIGVSWNSVTNASSYQVQRATDAAFTQNATIVYANTGLSVGDSGLSASTPYYYRVLSVGTGSYSNSGYSTAKSATTQATSSTPPKTGLNVLVTIIGTSLDNGYDGQMDQTSASIPGLLPSRLAARDSKNTYTVVGKAHSGQSARQWLAGPADSDLASLSTTGYDLLLFVVDHGINDAVQLLNGLQASGSQVFDTLTQVHQKLLGFGAGRKIATKTLAVTTSTIFSNAAYAGLSGYATAADASDVRATIQDCDARTRAKGYSALGMSDYVDLAKLAPFAATTPDYTIFLRDDLHETLLGYEMRADEISTGIVRTVAGGTPAPVVPYGPSDYAGIVSPEEVLYNETNSYKLQLSTNWLVGADSHTRDGKSAAYLPAGKDGTAELHFYGRYLILKAPGAEASYRGAFELYGDGGPATSVTQAYTNPAGAASWAYLTVDFGTIDAHDLLLNFTGIAGVQPIFDGAQALDTLPADWVTGATVIPAGSLGNGIAPGYAYRGQNLTSGAVATGIKNLDAANGLTAYIVATRGTASAAIETLFSISTLNESTTETALLYVDTLAGKSYGLALNEYTNSIYGLGPLDATAPGATFLVVAKLYPRSLRPSTLNVNGVVRSFIATSDTYTGYRAYGDTVTIGNDVAGLNSRPWSGAIQDVVLYQGIISSDRDQQNIATLKQEYSIS